MQDYLSESGGYSQLKQGTYLIWLNFHIESSCKIHKFLCKKWIKQQAEPTPVWYQSCLLFLIFYYIYLIKHCSQQHIPESFVFPP